MLNLICKVLNTKVWPDDKHCINEYFLRKQLESYKALFAQYSEWPNSSEISFADVKEGYFDIAKYAATYYPVHNSLLRIKVTGPSLQEFHETYAEKVIELWYTVFS